MRRATAHLQVQRDAQGMRASAMPTCVVDHNVSTYRIHRCNAAPSQTKTTGAACTLATSSLGFTSYLPYLFRFCDDHAGDDRLCGWSDGRVFSLPRWKGELSLDLLGFGRGDDWGRVPEATMWHPLSPRLINTRKSSMMAHPRNACRNAPRRRAFRLPGGRTQNASLCGVLRSCGRIHCRAGCTGWQTAPPCGVN